MFSLYPVHPAASMQRADCTARPTPRRARSNRRRLRSRRGLTPLRLGSFAVAGLDTRGISRVNRPSEHQGRVTRSNGIMEDRTVGRLGPKMSARGKTPHRAVPAHRIVGGGLGRRYDDAALRSEAATYSSLPDLRVRVERFPQDLAGRGGGEPGPRLCPDMSESLVSACLDAMVRGWEENMARYVPLAYRLPHELVARLVRRLAGAGKLTAPVLSGFLNPAALELDLTGCLNIPNSVFKQMGFCCPRVIYVNLSRCPKVNNAVVRSVLQGCSSLRQLYLDGCTRVTDAGFHLQQSPFYALVGCVSLETLSVQGCPQVTGALVLHLQKLCRNLKELNLARCKSVNSASVRRVFDACATLESLNISCLESLGDEGFTSLPDPESHPLDAAPPRPATAGPTTWGGDDDGDGDHPRGGPGWGKDDPEGCGGGAGGARAPLLRHLNLGRCGITDAALLHLGYFRGLESVHLEHCPSVRDEGVAALARQCRGLRAVSLSNCGGVTDASLAGLAAFCPALEWLDFSWCGRVTDTGVLRLIKGCQELEEVRAVWCEGITDLAVRALAACPRLRAVRISGCHGVTAAVAEELRVATGVEVTR